VTIAAGFKCSDGFVLCADTQESGTAFKRRVPKLEVRPKIIAPDDKCRVIITGSGSSSFVDSLIEELWKGAQRASESRLDEVTGRINSALIEHYRKIWSIYPKQVNPQYLPSADLMLAVWTRSGSELYLVRGHDMTQVQGYGALGCGDELAQFICEPLFNPEMIARQVVFLAVYMLEQVKQNVLNCGGESHIAILQNDGTLSTIPPIAAFLLTNHLASFDKALGSLLLASVDEAIDDKTFRRVFTVFRDEMTRLRGQYRMNRVEFWKDIAQAQVELQRIAKKLLLSKAKQSTSRKSKRAR
jgi:20S proteasome alpha/beta subunit